MFIGSHNTMTYLAPKQFWFRYLFPYFGKCQKIDYLSQYELGCRMFDIRLFFDSDGNIEYRHGLLRYSAENIDEFLAFCNKHKLYVRVLLEIRSYNEKSIKNKDSIRDMFISYCSEIEKKYSDVKFFGGIETGNGKVLYKFKGEPYGVVIKELHSSVTSLFRSKSRFLRVIDDLLPIIYARLRNKKNMAKYKDSDDKTYLLIDFIGIQ